MAILDDRERVKINTLKDWQGWLKKHHKQAEGVWVVSFKKHCGDRYVPYESVVEEALCFGWVDSHQRRFDDDRTQLYVSPRSKGSPWSGTNKKRVEKLHRENRLQSSGLVKIEEAKKDGSWSVYDDIEKAIEPPDLEKALNANTRARKNWDDFPRQARKNILWWIKSAKREETRNNRIAQAVEKAAVNKMVNHPD